MTKIAIDMMFRKLSDRVYSHTGAWAYIRANQLKHAGIDATLLTDRTIEDWSQFDQVFMYHTMDFDYENPGALNLFGGATEENAKHFHRLILPQHSHIKFTSLDYPMPNYGDRCKARIKPDSKSQMSDYWKNLDWDQVQVKCDSITDWCLDPGVKFNKPYVGRFKADWIKQCEGLTHIHDRLVIGDSHSISVYTPKSIVLRKDGRTLRGVLKKSIKKEITDFGYDYNQVKKLTCYWGNIDVRHHLCRESNPKQALLDLISSYEKELLSQGDREIEVVTLLPVEDESRKLPGSGLYLGTPFYGSRSDRQELVSIFNDKILELAEKHGWNKFMWPSEWYKMDGIEFMSEHMERPRSIHLSRKYYRWDLEQDIPNNLLMKRSQSLLQF